jgi:hypothetical protein
MITSSSMPNASWSDGTLPRTRARDIERPPHLVHFVAGLCFASMTIRAGSIAIAAAFL